MRANIYLLLLTIVSTRILHTGPQSQKNSAIENSSTSHKLQSQRMLLEAHEKLKAVLDNPDLSFRITTTEAGSQSDPNESYGRELKESGSIQAMIDAYRVVLQKYNTDLSIEFIHQVRGELAKAEYGHHYSEKPEELNEMGVTSSYSLGEQGQDQKVRDFLRRYSKELNSRIEQDICPGTKNEFMKKYCQDMVNPELKNNFKTNVRVLMFVGEIEREIKDCFRRPKSSENNADNTQILPEVVQKRAKAALNKLKSFLYEYFLVKPILDGIQRFIFEETSQPSNFIDQYLDVLPPYYDVSRSNFNPLKEMFLNQVLSTGKIVFGDREKNQIDHVIKRHLGQKQFTINYENQINQKDQVQFNKLIESVQKLIDKPVLSQEEIEELLQQIKSPAEIYPFHLQAYHENKKIKDVKVISILGKQVKEALLIALIDNYNRKPNNDQKMDALIQLITDFIRIRPFEDFNTRTFGALILNKELMKLKQLPSIMTRVKDFEYKTEAELKKEVIEGQTHFENLEKTGVLIAGHPTNEMIFFGMDSVDSLLKFIAENFNPNESFTTMAKNYFPDADSDFWESFISTLTIHDFYLGEFIRLTSGKTEDKLSNNKYMKLFKERVIKDILAKYPGNADPLGLLEKEVEKYI